MSQPSSAYVGKVVSWATSGVELAKVFPNLEQQFRARLCLECYKLFSENTSVPIRKLVQNIAARDYAMLMQNAALGSQEAQEMVKALGITRNEETGVVSARRETEISNDIYVVNQLVGRLSVAKNHIQRAMYEDNIEWLIGFAKKTGNVTAMREAQRNLEKINNDFKDEQNPADALKPGVERNITGDISIIKPDRTCYTPEELRAFAKKIGAKFEDVQEFIENEDGMMVPASDEDDGEGGEQEQSCDPEQTDEPDTYDPFAQ